MSVQEADSLSHLEERIRRAVELVAQLRAERDAAIVERDAARNGAGAALSEMQKLRDEVEELRGERKTVRVTIFNQTYSLAATDEEGEVEALAHSIDELMTSIATRAGNVDGNRVAVLACLHLADRLRSMERELTDLKDRVDKKSKQFSVLLDDVIR